MIKGFLLATEGYDWRAEGERVALETHDTHNSTGVKILQASQLRDIFKANMVTCKTDVYKCGTNKHNNIPQSVTSKLVI
jgi:hypothetical protein